MAIRVDAKEVPQASAAVAGDLAATCFVFAYAYLMCEAVLEAWKIEPRSTVVAALDGYALELLEPTGGDAAVLSLAKTPGRRVFGLIYELALDDGARLATLIAAAGEQRSEVKVRLRDAHGHARSAVTFVARGGNVTGSVAIDHQKILAAADRHHLPDSHRSTLAKVIGEGEGLPPRRLLA